MLPRENFENLQHLTLLILHFQSTCSGQKESKLVSQTALFHYSYFIVLSNITRPTKSMFSQAIEDEQLQNTAEKTVCHSDSILIASFSTITMSIRKNKIEQHKNQC